MKKRVLFGLIWFLLGMDVVMAENCDSVDLSRLKSLANNVSISYEYLSDSDIINNYRIYLSEIADEIFVVNLTDDTYHEWHAKDLTDGIVSFDSDLETLKFDIYSSNCIGSGSLRNISIELPRFNYYSLEDKCQEVKELNLDICDEWYQGKLDDFTFHEKIDKYITDNTKPTFFDFVIKYKFFILIFGVCLVLAVILLIIRYRKRSVLE